MYFEGNYWCSFYMFVNLHVHIYIPNFLLAPILDFIYLILRPCLIILIGTNNAVHFLTYSLRNCGLNSYCFYFFFFERLRPKKVRLLHWTRIFHFARFLSNFVYIHLFSVIRLELLVVLVAIYSIPGRFDYTNLPAPSGLPLNKRYQTLQLRRFSFFPEKVSVFFRSVSGVFFCRKKSEIFKISKSDYLNIWK